MPKYLVIRGVNYVTKDSDGRLVSDVRWEPGDIIDSSNAVTKGNGTTPPLDIESLLAKGAIRRDDH